MIVLIMELSQNGTNYLDAGMKTPMTEQTIKSEYVPREEGFRVFVPLLSSPAKTVTEPFVWSYERSPEYNPNDRNKKPKKR
jgi:hypothetical protein